MDVEWFCLSPPFVNIERLVEDVHTQHRWAHVPAEIVVVPFKDELVPALLTAWTWATFAVVLYITNRDVVAEFNAMAIAIAPSAPGRTQAARVSG
jgi:hypothetical protein